MQEIKEKILTICKLFNLGEFTSSKSLPLQNIGYILTEFKTDTGIYKHYFKM